MSAHADLRTALARAEALLAEAARARQAHPDDAPHPDRLASAQRAVEDAAAAAPTMPAGLARRVDRVRQRFALQAREAPPHDLDGLADDIEAAVHGSPWQRAGMSGSFLDAPRSLARWRGVAMAACVLLAVGVTVLGRAEVSFEEVPGTRPLAEPRDELLRRIDGAPSATSDRTSLSAGILTPMGDGTAVPVGGERRFDLGGPLEGADRGPSWSVRNVQPGQGFMIFHIHGAPGVSGSVNTFHLDERALLDAAGKQLRVRLLPNGAAPDERESN